MRVLPHKMAAKTSWHRYGTKLRHCHVQVTILSFLKEFLHVSVILCYVSSTGHVRSIKPEIVLVHVRCN